MAADPARELRHQTRWARLRASRPRLYYSLVVGIPVLCICSITAYLKVPGLIVAERVRQASVDIEECELVIGPNANSEIVPKVRVSISKSVLQIPLVSFKAHIKGFTATLWWEQEGQASGKEADQSVEIGTINVQRGVDMDSTQDVEIVIGDKVSITEPRSLSQVVSHFLGAKSITFGVTAKVDVQAYIYGWIPIPFYGISFGKDITIPAFNDFREKMVGLKDITKVHGLPGELNVTALAMVYNPTPVTVVLNDAAQLQIYYTWKGNEYRIGALNLDPPLKLKPGDNQPTGWARVHPEDAGSVEAVEAFAAAYIGPQHGLSPAGLEPFIVRMGDGNSDSPLVRAATEFLSLNVNVRPYPIIFLLAVTCDVTAIASPVPPFYEVVVHVRAKNPLPQEVRFHKVLLEARHLNLQGPSLYHYNHDLKPTDYVMGPLEEVTLDFRLNPVSEVSWDFLFSPKEIEQLVEEAAVQNVTGGLVAELTVGIKDGYKQVVPYKNEAISIQLCFHVTEPSDVCGGLPHAVTAAAPLRGAQASGAEPTWL